MTDTDGIPTIGSSEWARAFGHSLKVRRTDVGLSRQQLADSSAISYSYLAAIENGNKVPSTRIMRVLANRLGLEAKELLAMVDQRLERGSPTALHIPDEVIDVIETQEERFRRRQNERLLARGSAMSSTRRALLALVDTLSDQDIAVLTRVAEGLAARRDQTDE